MKRDKVTEKPLEPETPSIGRAMQIAATAHAGQCDHTGEPYLGHVFRVTANVRELGGSLDVQVIAVLHDVIEDAKCTAAGLLNLGIPDQIVRSIEILTRLDPLGSKSYDKYLDYIEQLLPNSWARLVKKADLMDNRDEERLTRVKNKKLVEKLRIKYSEAWDRINQYEHELAMLEAKRLFPIPGEFCPQCKKPYDYEIEHDYSRGLLSLPEGR